MLATLFANKSRRLSGCCINCRLLVCIVRVLIKEHKAYGRTKREREMPLFRFPPGVRIRNLWQLFALFPLLVIITCFWHCTSLMFRWTLSSSLRHKEMVTGKNIQTNFRCPGEKNSSAAFKGKRLKNEADRHMAAAAWKAMNSTLCYGSMLVLHE